MTPDEALELSKAVGTFFAGRVVHGGNIDVMLTLADEVVRMQVERDTPHTGSFLQAVELEALHQRARWGVSHDSGKAPADWFWLLGYLSGKALAAAVKGDRDKAMHHTISSAAALLNWHAALSGVDTTMRPGTEPPAGEL